MERDLEQEIYSSTLLNISEFKIKTGSEEYSACRYKINEFHIVCRTAKTTPKKIGQFVTF
ncbi:MAG: hypothetical protein ACJA1Z_003362 [Patiriisocius sp.]|jgi:hypothetical protein